MHPPRPLQFSASKSGLLLQCTRGFVVTPEEHAPSPEDSARHAARDSAADYGTRFHAAFAVAVERGVLGVANLGDEMRAHLVSALEVFHRWCSEDPWFAPLEVESAETPLASRFVGDIVKTRRTKFDEETHAYDLQPREWGGTPDLLLSARGGGRIVLDIKTGRSGVWDCPSGVPQLRTLALAVGAVGAAVLHAPRGGEPTVYAEPFGVGELREHAGALEGAMRRVAAGDETATKGPECRYCPARRGCPAWPEKPTKGVSEGASGGREDPYGGPRAAAKRHLLGGGA
jgi:hypothetical protein